jgi:hypothetical protein
MSTAARDEDKLESQLELDSQQEDESEPEEEPEHPGWLSLAEILKNPHPVFENGVFLIGYHFSSNIYVLAGDYLTVVDSGNDYTSFIQLFKLGFNPADIKKIVLTHGHRDHAMGTFELLRYPSDSHARPYHRRYMLVSRTNQNCHHRRHGFAPCHG